MRNTTKTAYAIGIVVMMACVAQASVIVGYDFAAGLSVSHEDSNVTAGAVDLNNSATSMAHTPDLKGADLGDNTGLTEGIAFSSAAGNIRATNANLLNTTRDAAIGDDDYFSFTIAPNSGFELNLGKIVFSAARAFDVTKSAESFALMSSITGFETTDTSLLDGAVTTVEVGLGQYQQFSVDVSGNSSFQGIQTSIEFRIYMWGGTGNGIQAAINYDNLGVTGDVLAIPEPVAPTGLTATEDPAGTVELNWTYDPNNDDEDGFIIEQSTAGGAFAVLATIGADFTTYSVSGLAPSTVYDFRVKAYNVAGESAYAIMDPITTTSSGVDVRAYQTAEGVVVEFVAYDVEADGTIQLALMDAVGNPAWTGTVDVVASPRFFARFLVPGLELGQAYDFQVRDEVGKWWDAEGVTVEPFAAEMVGASLAGITIAFDSLPEREYEIQWAAELGAEWVVVDTVTASGTLTQVVVPHPDTVTASGFFRVQLK